MLVYEETADDLHRELSRTEKSRHFVFVGADSRIARADRE